MLEIQNDNSSIIVAIDAANLRRGGGVTHLIELISVAAPEKFGIARVVIFGSRNILKLMPERKWLEKVTPPELDGGLLKRIFWQRFKLAKAAQELSCNIIFAPGGSYSGSFKPAVTMSRNMLPFEWRELRRYGFSTMTLKLLILRFVQSKTFRRVQGIVFLTDYAKKGTLKVTGSISGLAVTIPHGLNARFLYEPRVQRVVADYSEKSPCRVLYVSIIDQYKHQWHVVEAIAQLRKEGIPITLDLVGPFYSPALKKLMASMARFDAEGKVVRYLGAIEFDKLHKYYENADIGIFASSCENMPNILLETMASGLPIACSDRGPMPEVLGDRGIYFDPEQPKEIASAVRELIQSVELRESLAGASYSRAKQYSWQHCADKTFEFLALIAKSTTS